MNYIKLLFFISLTVLITSGCSGDGPANSDEKNRITLTAETFNNLRKSARSSRIQTAHFKVEDGLSFTSDEGVILDIPANCLSKNGSAASGEVELEYMELFKKADMIVTNRPTMGITASGDKKMLVTGGEFSINVSQNGQALEPSCGTSKLTVPGSNTGGLDTAMTKWSGTIDSAGNLSWEEEKKGENNVFKTDSSNIIGDNYEMLQDEFGWVNVDRFMTDPRPKTTLKIAPPQGYDADNSGVYLSYDGQGNALAQLDTYDPNFGLFSEHYGQVPIGVEMHVIFVSEEGGKWRYAIKSVTVAENDQYSFTLSETTVGSEQDLTSAIDALPQ